MSKSEFVLNGKLPHILKDNNADKSSSNAGFYHDAPNEECKEFYRKAVKKFKQLIQSDLSVFSKKNTIFDLLVRDEAELALIQNYRVNAYNSKVNEAKMLYRKIVKK